MKEKSPLWITVDVGRTKTRFEAWNFSRCLRRRTSPTVSAPPLKDQIDVWLACFPRPPERLSVGLRGVWGSQEKKKWRRKLRGLASSLRVLSDIELHYEKEFRARPGILLNAGTGSIALGRNKRGKTVRAGGWGPEVGDEGSAYWIGREYLKHVIAREGLRAVRPYVKAKDPVRKIATLARRALRDQRAGSICREARRHLLGLVGAVNRQLRFKKGADVVLAGGLFKNDAFRRCVIRGLAERGFRVCPSR